MKEDQKINYSQVQRTKRMYGLWFGLLAGLAFALGVWGLDALMLYRAHSEYPWIKLLLGLPFYLIIAGLVGWLTVKIDSGLLAFVLWMGTGLCFVFLASHMPYEGLSTFLARINPDYTRTTIYPFVESARMRMGLLYFIVGGLTAITSVLQFNFVEGALRASLPISRGLTLAAAMLVFAPIGLLTDNLINQPLRAPVVAVDLLLQNSKQAVDQPVTREKARLMGLRAVKPFGDLVSKPYTLVLGNYDPESQSETTVFVKFEEETRTIWGSCYVIDAYPSFCQLSTDLFIERLHCLMESGDEKVCRLKYDAGAEEDLQVIKESFGVQPPASIFDQRGQLVLITLFGPGDQQAQCELQVAGDIVLRGCEEVSGRIYEPAITPEPVLLERTDTGTQTAPAVAQSIIPVASQGLEKLQDAPHYTIFLEIQPEALAYDGQLILDYTNAENGSLPYLVFRLLPNGQGSFGNGSLEVSGILIDGKPAKYELSGSDTILQVNLPSPLEVGQKARLEFEFEGKIPRDFGGNQTPAGYGIFNLSDNVLALSAWYPMLAVYDERGWSLDMPSVIGDSIYSDTAFYSVSVNIPENYVVATSGIEEKRELFGNTQKLRYERLPARDFFIVASPDFKKVSREIDGTRVNVYYLPDEKRSADQALVISAESLKIFNQKFGNYPYTELDVVSAPMRNALGVEFPQIVLVSSDVFKTFEKPEFTVTIAHEISHQWWYNVVGNDVFQQPWLDESLATYSSSLYYELGPAKLRPSPVISYWQERYDQLVQDGLDNQVTQTLDYFESLDNPRIYGGIAYTKGALFFVGLREEIGDQAFFTALQTYYQANMFDIATTQDLLRVFEDAAGRSLDDFYQKWLY